MNADIKTTQIFYKLSKTSKVIQGHIRPLLCQNFTSKFINGSILIKICVNANIMKRQFFHEFIYDLKCNFYVIKFCDIFT